MELHRDAAAIGLVVGNRWSVVGSQGAFGCFPTSVIRLPCRRDPGVPTIVGDGNAIGNASLLRKPYRSSPLEKGPRKTAR